MEKLKPAAMPKYANLTIRDGIIQEMGESASEANARTRKGFKEEGERSSG